MRCFAARFLSMALVLLLLVSGGCQYGKHETPEEVFEAASKALKSRSYSRFCNCLAPKSQDKLAREMLTAGAMIKSMGSMFPDADEIPKGLDEARAAKAKEKLAEAKETVAMIDKIFDRHGVSEKTSSVDSIKDKPEFTADMLEAFDDITGNDQRAAELLNGTLSNVEVSGDTATGTLTRKEKGFEVTRKIHFAKIDDGWLIDLQERRFDGNF